LQKKEKGFGAYKEKQGGRKQICGDRQKKGAQRGGRQGKFINSSKKRKADSGRDGRLTIPARCRRRLEKARGTGADASQKGSDMGWREAQTARNMNACVDKSFTLGFEVGKIYEKSEKQVILGGVSSGGNKRGK